MPGRRMPVLTPLAVAVLLLAALPAHADWRVTPHPEGGRDLDR